MKECLRKLGLYTGISIVGLCALAWWHFQSLQVNYAKLEQLLVEKKWMEADLETNQIINKLLSKAIDKQTFFGYSSLNLPDGRKFRLANGEDGGLPCADLKMLDRLWASYSKGNFGFNAQLKIAKTIPGSLDNADEIDDSFAQLVGWHWTYGNKPSLHPEWYSYAENPEHAKGFLPSNLWALDIKAEKPIATSAVLRTLFHFETCKKYK